MAYKILLVLSVVLLLAGVYVILATQVSLPGSSELNRLNFAVSGEQNKYKMGAFPTSVKNGVGPIMIVLGVCTFMMARMFRTSATN